MGKIHRSITGPSASQILAYPCLPSEKTAISLSYDSVLPLHLNSRASPHLTSDGDAVLTLNMLEDASAIPAPNRNRIRARKISAVWIQRLNVGDA